MIRRRFSTGIVLVTALVALVAAPSVASGLKTWTTTSPANGSAYLDKSQDGCKARGIANHYAGSASTFWRDDTANSGYVCAFVRVRGYVAGGSAGYWTPWDKDGQNAKVFATGIKNGAHELFTE